VSSLAIKTIDPAIVQSIRERAAAIGLRMDAAALAVGRDPATVKLIAVTKFFAPETAAAACFAGLTDLGENRVQEMLAKQAELSYLERQPDWHLIGTLQKNKVRQVIGRTRLIHSGDSLDLLAEVSHRSVLAGLTSSVLLQINPACETTKHGFQPNDFATAAREAFRLPGLRIEGIMAIAPLLPNPADTLPCFRLSELLFQELCQIYQSIGPDQPMPSVLSMGMSGDFAQAISCGATHIRIGTALFGPRPIIV
jgi:pyridoxal phosphate enzyme (YggS family)